MAKEKRYFQCALSRPVEHAVKRAVTWVEEKDADSETFDFLRDGNMWNVDFTWDTYFVEVTDDSQKTTRRYGKR